MDTEEISNDLDGKVPNLSRLIKSWNLLEGSSKSYFDDLSKKILRSLYEGETEEKI